MDFAGSHMMRYGFDRVEIRACLPRLVAAGLLEIVTDTGDPLTTTYHVTEPEKVEPCRT